MTSHLLAPQLPHRTKSFFAIAIVYYGANHDNAIRWYPITVEGVSDSSVSTGPMSVLLPKDAEAVMVMGFGAQCRYSSGIDCIYDAFCLTNVLCSPGNWYHDEPRLCIPSALAAEDLCSWVANSVENPFDGPPEEYSAEPSQHVTASFVVDSLVIWPPATPCAAQSCWKAYLDASASSGSGTLSYHWLDLPSGLDTTTPSPTLVWNIPANMLAPCTNYATAECHRTELIVTDGTYSAWHHVIY